MRWPTSLSEPSEDGDDALEACMSIKEPIEVSVWIEARLRSCELKMNGLFWYKTEPGLPNASPKAGEKKAGVRGAVILAVVGERGAEVVSVVSRPSFPNRKSPFLTSPLRRKELDRPEMSTWRSLGRLVMVRTGGMALLLVFIACVEKG